MRPFDLFSSLNMERQTDQITYPPIEVQFYISLMFLGLPDDIHEEKPSIFAIKKKRITDRPTDGRTDRPSYRDARTHLKREREFTLSRTQARTRDKKAALLLVVKNTQVPFY